MPAPALANALTDLDAAYLGTRYNVCERALKKAILHRKNSLFYRTVHGAYVGDLYMSLIHTAELNGVEPFPWLVALMRNVEAVGKEPDAWLPWNFAARTR